MPTFVKPVELKTVARLTNQIKDITASNKKYTWANLHRIQAKDGRLTLFTNDGQSWLVWDLPLEEPTEDNYDVLISASQFNEIANNSLEGLPYEIREEGGFLILTQEPTQLRIREDAPKPYPETRRGQGDEWRVQAANLIQSFNFVLPFMDSSAVQDQLAVMTWFPEGVLVGGSTRLVSHVHGLPPSPVALSFRQKVARAIIAFLKTAEDEVSIRIDGNVCHFEIPEVFRRLTVATDTATFLRPRDLSGRETDVLKIDGSRLRSGVSLLKSLLPLDMNQLLVNIEGDHDNAVMSLTTSADEKQQSRDSVPIIRDFYNPENPLTRFSINQKVLESALKEMSGSILEVRYYGPHERILHLEDERLSHTDVIRTAMITVQDLSTPPLETPLPG
jgi:hypothetical protein